jgi:hypothetical protein
MNKQPKTTKKQKPNTKLEIRDMKPKKDPKAGFGVQVISGDPCEGGQLRRG